MVNPIRWSVTRFCGKLYVRIRSERSPVPTADLRFASYSLCASSLLEALLSDFSGKEIEVTIQTVGEAQQFEDNFVDISKVIQMEIEEEED